MTRLKLSNLADDKAVKITLCMPAKLYRDLMAYAIALTADKQLLRLRLNV